ncbi:MAG: hypothetical protein GX989_04355 [Firmicutes bacterium]|nr:hypothetical protein [Bacillota bacterium]
MDELQIKVDAVLSELKEQIIQFFEQGNLDDAGFLLEQYVKLAPTAIERYTLEAMLRAGKKDWEGAQQILLEGLAHHPLSFDLLYNRGFICQNNHNIFEAYNMYMKARYVAASAAEKADVAAALKDLGSNIKGSVKSEGGQISSIIRAGELTMTVTDSADELLRRKNMLGLIEKQLDKNAQTVLEIGFKDGIISKNLNYFGYDVTAVDRNKERMLQVMALEWHDNMLQARQKVAKFYYELVDLDWVQKIPAFDIIVAVADKNLAMFAAREREAGDILAALLQKARKQLFIRVAAAASTTEFGKEELLQAAAGEGLAVQTLGTWEEQGQNVELALVNKETGSKTFAVPAAGDVRNSRSTVFEVAVKKCVDLYGAGYRDDFQHFVAVLQEYEQNPKLTYPDSVLKTYYDRFQPKNTEEALFAVKGRAPRLRAGWIGFPWFGDKSRRVVFDPSPGETRPGGNHNFGPNTEEFGRAELGRLLYNYNLLQEEGYQPELFSDGYISGYLLVRGDDYRFVVTEGQHRMSCLAALGYEKIRVRFSQKPLYPQVVLWRDAKKWPQVANRAYSRNLALKIFARFFAGGVGRERMPLS